MNRWLLPLVAAIGVLVGAGIVWGWDRFAAPGGAERARVERIVRDYVLANPELIPQAIDRLRERESAKVVAQHRRAVETPFAGAWAGNPGGDVTLVEYYDYNCGYCRASLPLVAELIRRDPKLKVVYRELPVLAPSSRDAARASLAAAQQGRFAAFHDALYRGGPVSDASIAAAAKQAGVSLRTQADPKLDGEIETNLRTAASLGMTGTPSWVVGDRMLSGAVPIDDLEKAIAAARGQRES